MNPGCASSNRDFQPKICPNSLWNIDSYFEIIQDTLIAWRQPHSLLL